MPFRNPSLSRRTVVWGAPALAARRLLAQLPHQPGSAPEGGTIRSGIELFVDRHRIGSTSGVDLRMHAPRWAEPAIRFDRPWEGSTSAYVTVLEDDGLYRMYYRGSSSGGLVGADLLRRER